jgi:hypothetical protein
MMITKTVSTDAGTNPGTSQTTVAYTLGFWGFVAVWMVASSLTQVACAYVQSKAPLKEDEKPAPKAVD